MMVTGLLPDRRRREAVRVQADGRTVWTVAREVVERLGLREGESLPAGASAELEVAADVEAALRSGMRFLAMRSHAAREIRLKLQARGHSEEAIEGAAAQLERLGLIDDRDFAVAFLAERMARGVAPIRVKFELAAKGVADGAIQAAVRGVRESDEVEAAWERTAAQVRRRAAGMAKLSRDARRRRLMAFMIRRGFNNEAARELARELAKEEAPGD